MLTLTRREAPRSFPSSPIGSASSSPAQPRYVLVSPVHNEAKFIGRMIESILAQAPLPQHWVIVDDGSTDDTREIIRGYAQQHPFIDLIRLRERRTRKPGGESVIQLALEVAQCYPHDFLARFDTDLEFPPGYIAKILAEFARDEKLGIAGGGLYVEKSNGRISLEKVPAYHVRGGLKMYRRKCLEDIGSLCTHMGWDTIDEVYAWKHGWKTRSFFENRVIHKRPSGEGLSAKDRSHHRGRGEYYTWSHPLYVLLKAAKLAASSPVSAQHFFRGFLECYWKREQRLQDPDFKRIRRKQQLTRLITAGLISDLKF